MDAALACFAERGMIGTSMEEIAERAGVGRATIYYNFLSKDDIAVRIAERFRAQGYEAYLREREEGADALTLIRSFFRFAGTWVTQHREVALVATLASVRGVGRNPDRPGTNQVLRQMVEDAQAQGQVGRSVAAATVAGALNGLLLQCALIGSPDPAVSQEEWLLGMVNLVLEGARG
ncbi:MAG: helix-turn-helix domain containing protein [Candidatus Andeanibacterium colombiense]|uniref:Helix-turn-helix domain containing protein n=1 Tax=Candidatus Andeanibacterium colombiense TaxID=3121345 RepID=A0AAJ5X556_9SPHN|nr:MAG: helix-turn-helix domain containing protein [Sphingomonadaceae bacterium]